MMDKFRVAKVPRHVRIYHDQLKSEAWRNLSGGAVKVLLALASLEYGENNGEFYLSSRTGAQITGLGKNAVARALRELQDKGFIYCTEQGGFSRKTPHAARWGLTWVAGPKGSEFRAPSHAYKKWVPGKLRDTQLRDATVVEIDTDTHKITFRGIANGDSKPPKRLAFRQIGRVSKKGSYTSNQSLLPANDNHGACST